ncbi:hypothetical protein EIN_087410 [Entamoeba invadens IP1]|uniref:hypothetical protein n=1 Tax=Entamoeba invadens IP1 TaxID=370355 RepID=UPI0002C3DE51|nr:hypothetical protein EIN_087410 [Entamoeba invadens IP1]ELP85429.1 hypothetical protein EIN_087410 [Entamoeba invadens IP1]|eukprot:XP_004184775.1 hypothetical protein EIN_087410 [Entamoeba invadens IP1]
MYFLLFVALSSAMTLNEFAKLSSTSRDKISSVNMFFRGKAYQSLSDIKHSEANDKIVVKMMKKTVHRETKEALREFIKTNYITNKTANYVDIAAKTHEMEADVIKGFDGVHTKFVQAVVNTTASVKKVLKAEKIEATVSNAGVKTIGVDLAKQLRMGNNVTSDQLEKVFNTSIEAMKNVTQTFANSTKDKLEAIAAAVKFIKTGEMKMLESYNKMYTLFRLALTEKLFVNHTIVNSTTEKSKLAKQVKVDIQQQTNKLVGVQKDLIKEKKVIEKAQKKINKKINKPVKKAMKKMAKKVIKNTKKAAKDTKKATTPAAAKCVKPKK